MKLDSKIRERVRIGIIVACIVAGIAFLLFVAYEFGVLSSYGTKFSTSSSSQSEDIHRTPLTYQPIEDVPSESGWDTGLIHDDYGWEWVYITDGSSISVIPHLDANGSQIRH